MKNKIRQIVANQLDIDLEEVKMDSSLIDLGADSLDIVEIVMEIESELGLEEISDEQAEKFKTVQDIVDCVEGL